MSQTRYENVANTVVVDTGIRRKLRKGPRVHRYHINDAESGQTQGVISEDVDDGTCWWGDYLNMNSGIADSLEAAHAAFIRNHNSQLAANSITGVGIIRTAGGKYLGQRFTPEQYRAAEQYYALKRKTSC